MILTTRPLVDRHWIGTHPSTRSQFTTTWSATLGLLEREVYAIQSAGMPDPILMVDCQESDLRLDGQLRANARLATSAVALSFESVNGPLLFRCDRYDATPWNNKMQLWQHNIRAIALTLEALRAVNRYGATQSGEQYTGYRQIGSTAAEVPLAADYALRTLARIAGVSVLDVDRDRLISLARRKAHPDTGGSAELWAEFTRAYEAVR
jgi:hypothetical protein